MLIVDRAHSWNKQSGRSEGILVWTNRRALNLSIHYMQYAMHSNKIWKCIIRVCSVLFRYKTEYPSKKHVCNNSDLSGHLHDMWMHLYVKRHVSYFTNATVLRTQWISEHFRLCDLCTSGCAHFLMNAFIVHFIHICVL